MDINSMITVCSGRALEVQKQELARCNEISAHYALALSPKSMERLLQSREKTLQELGRVEFAGGILPKLIMTFSRSPYIYQAVYEDTLAELQEIFYSLKNETRDRVPDDDILSGMVRIFNGRAGGSTEYLSQLSWDEMRYYSVKERRDERDDD